MKLPYALKGDRIVTIHQVPGGLDCGCRCPACFQPLVGKKGTRMLHHFAHHRGSECGAGLETALHYLAKGILEKHGKIVLPPVFLPNASHPFFPAYTLSFDQIWLERPVGSLIPDLIIRKAKRLLFLELAVTHFSGPDKIDHIRQNRQACIEINLMAIVRMLEEQKGFLDQTSFEQQLIYGASNKEWLFNPKQQATEKEIRIKAECKRVSYSNRKGNHIYGVHPCPQRKRYRQWGGTWALVFQDCLHCPFCLEINYKKEYRGFRDVYTVPESVCCWANVAEEGRNG